jgi:hypothetical protein
VQNKILEGEDDFAAKNGLSARFKMRITHTLLNAKLAIARNEN